MYVFCSFSALPPGVARLQFIAGPFIPFGAAGRGVPPDFSPPY